VGDLADRLGVDERTVRRYAEHLAELDVPIRSERGRYGGYRLAPGFKLPPLMLTDDEALAVVLGLVAGQRAGLVTGPAAAMESASAKVRRVLPAPLARRLDALLDTADFTGAARPATTTGSDVLLVLAEAAQQRRPVAITYTSWGGRSSERTLHPYGLVFHSGRWYVTGADSRHADVRTFRLDRVGTASLAAGTFDVPADFDPADRVLTGLADVSYPHEASVLLDAGVAEVRAKLPVSVATVTEVPGGGVRLRLRANRLEWAASVIAWLGFPFVIESPDELRTEVRALATRLTEGADRASR
jgi:predicted DNA-binding transcriptional regulator YafY